MTTHDLTLTYHWTHLFYYDLLSLPQPLEKLENNGKTLLRLNIIFLRIITSWTSGRKDSNARLAIMQLVPSLLNSG